MRCKLSLTTSFGFVLAELVVVLAILAGLAVTTFPALSYWLARERLDTYAQALLATFSYARSEALKRGVPVTVCRADERGECSVSARVCSANEHGTLADDWGCGYAVFVETISAVGEGFQQALRVQAPLEGVTLQVKNASPLWFTPPVGQIVGGFRSFELVARFSTDSNLSKRLRRCVRISAGGRTRLINGPCPVRVAS